MKKVLLSLIIGLFVMGSTSIVLAGDGEKGSMKGSDHDLLMETRKGDMQAAMVEYIKSNSVDEVFELKDETTGKTRKLSYLDLHDGVGMKDGKHYSCADFKDLDSGEMLDVDIYVDIINDDFKVVDAVIHKVDGQKVSGDEAEMKGSDQGGSMKGSDSEHKGSMKGSGY